MFFNFLPIEEIKTSDDSITNSFQGKGGDLHLYNKIIDYTHVVDEDFLLVLLLTSRAELIIHYKTGTSSRLETIPIHRLFPQKNFPAPIIVSITEDCAVVVILLSDGHSLQLIPFRALMDVTWGQKSTPLATKPTIFSVVGLDLEDVEMVQQKDAQEFQVRAAICFYSTFTEHTHYLYGNKNGSLYIFNLNLRRVSMKIDLKHGINSLHLIDEKSGAKQLLITHSDRTQLILPLESKESSIRETFTHLSPSQFRPISDNLFFVPQIGGIVCALDSYTNQLLVFDSFPNLPNVVPLICLDGFPAETIEQVLLTPRMIVAFDRQNKLFVHLRFLQQHLTTAKFEPFEVPQVSSHGNGNQILGLIPSLSVLNGDDQQLECPFIASEFGLYLLRSQSPLNSFILDHLCSHFFSYDCLSSVASSLDLPSPSLCLSLLRSLLRNSSDPADDSSKLDGLLSLAFKCKVDPDSLLSILGESGKEDLLLPFIRIKFEKNPSDPSICELFLGALLRRLEHILEEETKCNGNVLESEKDSLELELRHFLLKFDVNDAELLSLMLRYSLWSCVCVILSRDPKTHSPSVARFLLELPNWKSIKRIGGLLKCLSYLHWPSLDSYVATLVVKLFNLVPVFDIAQLKIVNQIAQVLEKRSIESALSLHLVCSIRICHYNSEKNLNIPQPKLHSNIVDSGSNCTVLLAEDAYGTVKSDVNLDGSGEGENGIRPFFWGQFSAGTLRLIRSDQSTTTSSKEIGQEKDKNGQDNITLANKRRRAEVSVDEGSKPNSAIESTSKRACNRKKGALDSFPSILSPRQIEFPHNQMKIHSVVCGTEHVLLLSTGGRLFVWGRNRFGQCGTGSVEQVASAIEITGNWGQIIGIFAGHYHSALINKDNQIYLWGWGLHGQLGNGAINDLHSPTECIAFSKMQNVKSLCLGYAHTLALCSDGRVFGCGAVAYGQLGMDPRDLERNPLKIVRPIQLPFPVPITQLASKYFHGIALGLDGTKTLIFEWGESPQSLKMKMFLQKRLRAKDKKTTDKEHPITKISAEEAMEEGDMVTGKDDEHSNRIPTSSSALTIDLPRDHLHIKQICEWNGGPVKALSAGFNHSALLTADGELFTWGKSLELQLGHRSRKERAQPTKVEEPKDTRWAWVICARNFTTAISTEGQIFVWGRNDKNQLGLGQTPKKPTGTIRRIALKSERGMAQRSVELPADNCIETPKVVPGLRALTEDDTEQCINEEKVNEMILNANQLSLNALSRFLLKHPILTFMAVQAHLMAGDLLAALRLIVQIEKRDQFLKMAEQVPSTSNGAERPVMLIAQTNPPKEGSPNAKSNPVMKLSLAGGRSPSKSSPTTTTTMISSSPTKRSVAVRLRSTFCSSSSAQSPSQTSATNFHSSSLSSSHPQLEQFHVLVDKIWALLRTHPIREVQTIALVELLSHRFPIYNRLASDLRLCRLVDPFLSTASSLAESSSSFSSRVRLLELGVRDRANQLRQSQPPDLGGRHYKMLKARCDKLLAEDRLRFFADCGHFEKCVVESGPARSELIALRNSLRRCTKCVSSGRHHRQGTENATFPRAKNTNG